MFNVSLILIGLGLVYYTGKVVNKQKSVGGGTGELCIPTIPLEAVFGYGTSILLISVGCIGTLVYGP